MFELFSFLYLEVIILMTAKTLNILLFAAELLDFIKYSLNKLDKINLINHLIFASHAWEKNWNNNLEKYYLRLKKKTYVNMQ